MPDDGPAHVAVRLADPADSPRCAEIFLAGRRAASPWLPPGLFRLRDYYDSIVGEEVWVAEANDQIVGFISAALPDKMIRNLFVDAAWRNLGIGRRLLDCALNHLAGTVHLHCASRNATARFFYEHNGWTLVENGETAEGDMVLYQIAV